MLGICYIFTQVLTLWKLAVQPFFFFFFFNLKKDLEYLLRNNYICEIFKEFRSVTNE